MRPVQSLVELARDAEGYLDGEKIAAMEHYVDPTGVVLLKENRAANEQRGLPTVPAEWKVRDGKVAIVGYGPSLQDTWRDLLRFDGMIWTTSKTHDFLREKGVTPDFHTDVDFRPHKTDFNDRFTQKTRYILNTGVHPSYLDKLYGLNVVLFNVLLPSGGGPYDMRYAKFRARFDAGLQAAEVAYSMGFRDQVWYGIDCSHRNGARHAGEHGGLAPELERVQVRGVKYETSQLLVRQLLDAELMLRQNPKQRVRITGDGLIRPFLQARRRVRLAG